MKQDLAQFPYVNGGLFADENIEIPMLNEKVKKLLLSKASEYFDWSEISPTIFGAVFESTLNPETRRSGGMHYTSIENIHKVIDFIKKLKIEKPILYGFSDGGIVGIMIAIKEPALLEKLIVSGANITPDVFTTFDLLLTKIFYFFTRSKYIKMMLKEPNISLKDLQDINIPVHVLAGEKDALIFPLHHKKDV